jgi:2-polyprenyl-3-methyl-5-hydroxy-6-metoxy-1,4-benzoquinol methylase
MFDWRTHTEDPNNQEVAKAYREHLLSIREFKLIPRDEFLLDKCRDKEVMDIGSCEHTETYMKSPDWFFGKLTKVAKRAVGVDINEKLTIIAQEKMGLDIRYADATSDKDFGEKFDVIHAGDVIQHVSNLGGLLSVMKRHLKPDGEIIITTPNPFYDRYFFGILSKATLVPNFEHTCWVTPTCMHELAVREGLELTKICYPVKPSSGRKFMVKFKPSRRWMEFFSGEYIYILKLKS